MKSIFFTALILITNLTIGMEKDQPFPNRAVNTDTESTIIKLVNNAKNPLEAIQAFKNLLVSKELITNDSNIFNFLARARNKFPDQEVRMARLLNNDYAKLWLSKIKPALESYELMEPSKLELNKAFSYIEKRQIPLLAQWLNKGFDPNARNEDMSLLYKAIKFGDLDAIKQLISYGADVNQPYNPNSPNRQTPLGLITIYRNLGLGNGQVYQLIADYLKSQGAVE
ncbi:MAG: ankyrin repeat domain-containing protein [Candidatus Dependentiae bacterium]